MGFEIDHVIAVVSDLDDAAARLLATHGLASIVGGRHEGHGTGNRIVPLGSSYLELMAVLDPVEAAGSPVGSWAARAATAELAAAALCLRTDDIAAISAALEESPLAMSRRTPDGTVLSWRLVGLDGMVTHGRPFFIEWETIDHPGRSEAPHTVLPHGIVAAAAPAFPDAAHAVIGDVQGVTFGAERITATIETSAGTIDL